MKGNVFSQWLKEFCALVFTQTVQAFLLSIILLIVIISISNGSNDANNYNNVTAGGVLAIIALTSISKMEALIKKLFGLESSITDTSMKGGRGGLLGSVVALKMAKKALDNVPKIGKGISGHVKSYNDVKKAKMDSANKLNRLNARYGISGSEAAADGISDSNSNSNTQTNSTSDSMSANSTSSRARKIDDKYLDKKEAIIEEYNKKMADIKSSRKQANRNLVSGVLETGGAILGGATGATAGFIMAAGTGDDKILDNTLKGMGTGIGVGDTVGSLTTKATFAPKDLKDTISNYSSVRKKYKSMQDDIERFEKAVKKFNAGDID